MLDFGKIIMNWCVYHYFIMFVSESNLSLSYIDYWSISGWSFRNLCVSVSQELPHYSFGSSSRERFCCCCCYFVCFGVMLSVPFTLMRILRYWQSFLCYEYMWEWVLSSKLRQHIHRYGWQGHRAAVMCSTEVRGMKSIYCPADCWMALDCLSNSLKQQKKQVPSGILMWWQWIVDITCWLMLMRHFVLQLKI